MSRSKGDEHPTYHVFHLKTKGDAVQVKERLFALASSRAILDAHKIICKQQVEAAIFRTGRAKRNHTMIAQKWNVEVLLQIVGTHQIKHAMQILTVTEETKIILVIQKDAIIPDETAVPGFPKFQLNNELMKIYGIEHAKDACLEVIARGARLIVDHA
ncbi:MAG: hypothetical protein ACXAD7_00660 [Candidatus Kariarchaeaceae archaeon]|jgi:tRNA threonylcarbamoyladenosine modification (KEOPS) complex Cgi121 subunit